jgi:hypothetical protein
LRNPTLGFASFDLCVHARARLPRFRIIRSCTRWRRSIIAVVRTASSHGLNSRHAYRDTRLPVPHTCVLVVPAYFILLSRCTCLFTTYYVTSSMHPTNERPPSMFFKLDLAF